MSKEELLSAMLREYGYSLSASPDKRVIGSIHDGFWGIEGMKFMIVEEASMEEFQVQTDWLAKLMGKKAKPVPERYKYAYKTIPVGKEVN